MVPPTSKSLYILQKETPLSSSCIEKRLPIQDNQRFWDAVRANGYPELVAKAIEGSGPLARILRRKNIDDLISNESLQIAVRGRKRKRDHTPSYPAPRAEQGSTAFNMLISAAMDAEEDSSSTSRASITDSNGFGCFPIQDSAHADTSVGSNMHMSALTSQFEVDDPLGEVNFDRYMLQCGDPISTSMFDGFISFGDGPNQDGICVSTGFLNSEE